MEDEYERVVLKSFKQGFGFFLGFAGAIVLLSLLISILAYLAVLGGFITVEELFLL
jgi:nucleoside permease NupC